MPRLPPISHAQLVAGLRRHGFEGPYAGGKHLFMLKGELRLTIPSPHSQDIAPALPTRILRQTGLSREEWLNDSPDRDLVRKEHASPTWLAAAVVPKLTDRCLPQTCRSTSHAGRQQRAVRAL